jgi:hypothetical protein
VARHAGAGEHRLGQRRVPARRSEHEHAALERLRSGSVTSERLSRRRLLVDDRNAGEDAAEAAQRRPDLDAPLAMRNSRMLRSCAPPRFFTTEIAWRTSPASRSSAAG